MVTVHGFRGAGFKVQGSGFRVQSLRFRVQKKNLSFNPERGILQGGQALNREFL
jgi:hypothetical protein